MASVKKKNMEMNKTEPFWFFKEIKPTEENKHHKKIVLKYIAANFPAHVIKNYIKWAFREVDPKDPKRIKYKKHFEIDQMYKHALNEYIIKYLYDKDKDNLNKIEFLNEDYKGGKSRKKSRKISKKKKYKKKTRKKSKKNLF